MANGLENTINANAVTSDYPWKDIKDNTGGGNGTKVNRLNHADYFQTWRKLLALAGITPNGLPDNVTNGYQYVQALDYLYRRLRGTSVTSGSSAVTASEVRKLISVEGASAQVDLTLDSSFSNFADGDSFIIRNNSDYVTRILRTAPDTFEINGLPAISPIELPANGDFVELVLDKANNAWRAVYLKQTPVTHVFNTISDSLASSTSDILKFATNELGNASLYDALTGRFTPTVKGVYEITWGVSCSIAVVASLRQMGSYLRKNGVNVGQISDRVDVYTDCDYVSVGSSVLVEANGTTDYFDIELYCTIAIAKDITGNFHAKKIA